MFIIAPVSAKETMGATVSFYNKTEYGTYKNDSPKAVYDMEVAYTKEQKQQGLMFRKSLLPRTGMLFYYAQPQKVGIWMKNTIIPLDILFVTCNYTIEKIVKNRQPGNLIPVYSDGKVCYIAEISAGEADKFGLDVGDVVVIKKSGVR